MSFPFPFHAWVPTLAGTMAQSSRRRLSRLYGQKTQKVVKLVDGAAMGHHKALQFLKQNVSED